ncbi:MAG: chorismate synthase [Chloroflexia bacterium]|nr:chorismate synthase [Chloroflexia bacterium]
MRFLTAGESHGPCLTAIIEGLPAGLEISVEVIDCELARRQVGYGRGERMQIEEDHVEILGGLLYGRTTGAPLALRIENRDWPNWRRRWEKGELYPLRVPRPGHADYAGMLKYGLDDARLVLERASARETAARVAVGAVVRQLLGALNVTIGSYVDSIGPVEAAIPDLPPEQLWARAEPSDLRCPDEEAAARMHAAIDDARGAGDSLGGTFTVMATGVPAGLGSYVHWDRRLDGRLAAALLSIPAIKGVEIGPAFANARRRGTQVHDALYPDPAGGAQRRTNRAGGVEGGVSNGMPLVVRAAMKPLPSTVSPLHSVDLETGRSAETQYQRADVCAVPAASIVGEAMVAWVLAEAVLEKWGGDRIEQLTVDS